MKNSCWGLGFLSSQPSPFPVPRSSGAPRKTTDRDGDLKRAEEGGWTPESPHILALPRSPPWLLGGNVGDGASDPREMAVEARAETAFG